MSTYFHGNEYVHQNGQQFFKKNSTNHPSEAVFVGGYHNLVPHDHPNGASPAKSINVKPGQSLWIWGSSVSDDWLINLDGMDMNGYTVIYWMIRHDQAKPMKMNEARWRIMGRWTEPEEKHEGWPTGSNIKMGMWIKKRRNKNMYPPVN